ncbi:hypothetical protein K2173_010491 [Erythroxylum novogranatense]|uniref:Uncharacterized protein n=1 Tax=Erythroxylum novogranatense TaxID=1862640 RepID=A0AAV8TFS8_9ROSI|nr:hypothetical protein K2173_010491 [Erythroxylum novogranatense]
MTTSTVSSLPLAGSVGAFAPCKGQIKHRGCHPVGSLLANGRHSKLVASGPVGLVQLPAVERRRPFICAAVQNARCSASGQTQTVTREAPTITKAPVREPAITPKLDDGGPGFPPGGDDGGGGGGGGGGGNWSGGFFLFGFLAFLGFLKDKESEEDYRDSRRR